jgi:DNA-binding GntR family transcriptional regulator
MAVNSDRAYTKLKTMIYGGDLSPGERIVERDLAQQLGISRIPLRESMARLENEGLIRSVPNHATHVEDFEPRDLLEIYSMRLWLEPPAARMVALRRTKQLVVELRRLCDQMAECIHQNDVAKLDETDYKFHYAIVLASEHRRLIRAYETSHIRITGLRSDYATQTTQSPEALTTQHETIIRCIEQCEAQNAERAAYDHVCNSLIAFKEKLGMRLEDIV